jgi:hypothetical protein
MSKPIKPVIQQWNDKTIATGKAPLLMISVKAGITNDYEIHVADENVKRNLSLILRAVLYMIENGAELEMNDKKVTFNKL